MGGKTKTSQRTKNNARPSSSGRSAELLNNAAAGIGTVPVLFPSLATINIDQGLSAEYSVCFKKFNKKDPVTKTKALQELTELVKTGNVEDAEAALPSWAHHYQLLTVDSDRRVREATQCCHGALVSACGRRAAPQLRRLLPVWLLAAHDDHAPVGSQAQTHLQNTFPEGKLSEALSFCKSEIMTLLSDNLTGNADAMVGKRTEDEEERQAQVSRVAASSLHALQLVVVTLPRAQHDWLWGACVERLLQNNHFWGLLRNPDQHIRAAWYGAMGRIIEQFGSRMSPPVAKKAAKALVAEPERNARVAAQRWAALLLLMKHVAEWHLLLEKKDLLITRVLDMIENGAWGEARLLSSMLVPLLASLPPDLLTKHFYIKFFDAIFTSLNNKNVLNSKSERQTWVSNISECVRHLSTQNHDFVVEVTTYVHRTWLERVLDVTNSQARSNLTKHSMTNMSSLIKHWLNLSKLENEKYDQLTRNFWQNFCSTILTRIDKLSIEQEDIVQSIETHILLLKTLHTTFLYEPRKKLSIQFEDQVADTIKIDSTTEKIVNCDEQLKERFVHNLNDLARKTCCGYLDLAHKKQVSQAVCPVLVNLLMEFDDRDMFVALARHFGADSVYGFYDRCLRPWLAGDTMRCQALVEMVFLMVKYLSEDEQDRMFTSFQQFPPPVVEWCIHLTLSHPHSLLPAGKRWMRGSVVEATVVALCQREGDSKAASLLLACVADDDTGDVIVSESTVVRVVGAVSARLAGGARDEHALRRARTAAELAGALLSGAARAHAPPLLSALLRYQLRLSQNSEQHGTAAWSEVWEAWRDALPARCRHPLLTRALHDLRDHVLHDITELDIKRIEDAASLCPCLFGTSADDKPSIADIVSLAKQLFTHVETEQLKTPLELYALRCDCIHGHISPAFQRNNELCKRIGSTCEENHEELSKDDLMISVYKSLFRVYFLRKITLNVSEDDVEKNSWCNLLLSDSYFKEELGQVLYDYAVINTLFEYYAFWPHYEIINQTKKQMESVLEDIITDITVQTKDAIYSFLTESFAKKGFYGPFARKLFENKFNEVTAKVHEQHNKTTDNPSELLEHSLSEQENDVLNGNVEQNISENAQNNAKTLDQKNYVTIAEDNVCKSKIDQKDSKDDSQENLEAKLLQGDSENTLKVQDYALQSEQSNSKTEIVQKTSEPESDQKNNESKSEMKNLESKSNQNKSESVSEQIISKSEQSKSSSDSEQSKTESTSEHHEAHELFADKSVYVDEAKWTELLGFPSLQEVVSNNEYYLHLQAEAKYSPEASRDLSTRYMAMMRGVLCAHVHEPAAAVQLLADVADATAAGPDPVINGYYKRRHLMLFERALTGVPWVHVLSNVAVVDYLSELVQLRGAAMHANHWDFVNIALSSLLESVHLTAHRWATTNVSALLRAATRLLTRVHAFMRALRCSAEAPPARLSALLREWDDIFVPDINRHLFTVLLAVLRSTDTPITASSAATIGSLIAAARCMEWRGEASGTPGVSVEGLAEAAISALRGMTHHAYKYLAFHTLELMAKPLVFEDAQKLKEWSPEEDAEKPRPANCFRLFDGAMNHLHECTEAALANVQLCEGTCEMVPFSDSHGVSLSYMLLAASLQRACSFARGDLHHVYTAQFRDGMYAVGLMSCTLRLLPGAVAEFAFMRGPALSPDVLQCFQRLPALDVYERCSAGTVSALACYVMTETLGGAGAADARVWSGTAPARVPAALRRLVTAAVTPVLLQRHLTQLRDRADELSDTRVSIAWSRGEVQCWLELEEHELELTVRFAPDHPLTPPALATSPHSPAPDTSWLVMYLAYQNGTLLNALKMWRRALNARLQSAPQCYVCYVHLHPASGRLPAKRCHQCRNKFHAECLNKWFKHNPTKICPLCRAKMAPRHQSQS